MINYQLCHYILDCNYRQNSFLSIHFSFIVFCIITACKQNPNSITNCFKLILFSVYKLHLLLCRLKNILVENHTSAMDALKQSHVHLQSDILYQKEQELNMKHGLKTIEIENALKATHLTTIDAMKSTNLKIVNNLKTINNKLEGEYLSERERCIAYMEKHCRLTFLIPPPPLFQTCFNVFVTYLLYSKNTQNKSFF